MKKKLPILVIYKRSFLAGASSLSDRIKKNPNFVRNHSKHNETLRYVEKSIASLGVPYDKITRRPGIDYKGYGLIIAVGGDGTLLEVARGINRHQLLLGVNSDPSWSVGKFCHANVRNFNLIMNSILKGAANIKPLYKIRILIQDGLQKKSYECLNDILICHANPAAMSRYIITIGDINEEHRNSGIWISSAAGSTGAILSAGGSQMQEESRMIQYKPRELYHMKVGKYRLTGGLVDVSERIKVMSLMREGNIFLDGAHVQHEFEYGCRAVISHSLNFVRLIYGP